DYKKLVSFLLSTRLHMILCSRAKQPILEAVVDGEKTLVPQSWEPIQDKRLKYEMTIVVPMTLDGAYETEAGRLKVPGDLAHLFRGELLDERTGAAIAEWVTGGKPVDHALELLRRAAFEAASCGTESFTKWWNAPALRPRRQALRPDLDNLASLARAADEEIARERRADEAARQQQRDRARLDEPFGKLPIRGNGSVKSAAQGGFQWRRRRHEYAAPPHPLRASSLLRCAFDRRAALRLRFRPIVIATHPKNLDHPLLVETRSCGCPIG